MPSNRVVARCFVNLPFRQLKIIFMSVKELSEIITSKLVLVNVVELTSKGQSYQTLNVHNLGVKKNML